MHRATPIPLLASFLVEIQLSKRLSGEEHSPVMARQPSSSAGPRPSASVEACQAF